MQKEIRRSIISGSLMAPQSAPFAHRAIYLSALSPGQTQISNLPQSPDIQSTISVCSSLGSDIVQSGATADVFAPPSLALPNEVRCRDSNTTLKIALAICASLGTEVKVSVSGRLSSADLSPFLEFLKSAGAQADYSVSFPARLHGPISLQERIYSGGLGSQFLSGILLVSPLVENGASIGVAGSLAGISHVKETIILMKECGIRFHSDSLPFLSLTGRQGYSPPSEIIVHSSPYLSAFPLLAGALCGKATLKGSCDWQSHCEVFREFGAAVSMHRHEISVSASSLAGAQLEASELGEYLLHAMVLASASDGQTTISNLHSLPLRHQSRARKLARELGRMGARINEEKGGFTINGGKLIGAKVEPDGDASVAMACACAAVCASGTTTIMGAECVEKSYPGFFLGLESLGATVR